MLELENRARARTGIRASTYSSAAAQKKHDIESQRFMNYDVGAHKPAPPTTTPRGWELTNSDLSGRAVQSFLSFDGAPSSRCLLVMKLDADDAIAELLSPATSSFLCYARVRGLDHTPRVPALKSAIRVFNFGSRDPNL